MSTVSRVSLYPRPCILVTWPHSPWWHPTQTLYWILMSAISRVTPKTIYLGSHVHSLQGQPLLRHCTLGHKSIVPRVTAPSQNLYLGIWVHSPGRPHLPDTAPGVTRPKSPGCPTFQTMALGSFVQLPRWTHLPTLYLWSNIHTP